MRLAFLPSSYLPESLGGTEIYVHHLSEALTDIGHEIAVICHRPPNDQSDALTYEVISLDQYPAKRRADLYLHACSDEPPGFAQFLREWNPDLLHFHALTLGAGVGHARVASQYGIPYVITYHTPTISCPRGTLMRWGREVCDGFIEPRRCAACVLQSHGWPGLMAQTMAQSPLPWSWLPEGPWIPRLALPSLLAGGLETWREFMGGAAQIIACACWCRDVLVANEVPAHKITVLRQALPGADRTRRLKLPIGKSRPIKLGFFGRFCWVKGPDLLLQAAQQLVTQGIPAVCELVGPIAENERAWAQALLADYKSLALYHGVKRGSDLTQWIMSLDLIVIPSRCLETGPLTLLEAWDQGIPVIGADLGGIREFMHDAGMQELLFAPDDANDVARAVRCALEWPVLRQPSVHINGMAELSQRMDRIYRETFAPIGTGSTLS